MNTTFKLAVLSLMLMSAWPVTAQMTNEYLKPCDYKGKISRSGDNMLCWGQKVEPSFAESYEIQCWCNTKTNEFSLKLMVQNQEDPHILDIDEDLAYQIRTLVDAAVFSATNLPDKEWMRMTLEALKNGTGTVVSVGMDGTTFRFYSRNFGAQCWSPNNGNNAALVNLFDVIYNAIGNKDVEKIKSKLDDIKSLTRKYASLLQDPYREYLLLRIDKKPNNWWWAIE